MWSKAGLENPQHACDTGAAYCDTGAEADLFLSFVEPGFGFEDMGVAICSKDEKVTDAQVLFDLYRFIFSLILMFFCRHLQ